MDSIRTGGSFGRDRGVKLKKPEIRRKSMCEAEEEGKENSTI
jgi:hypothetical protein